MGSLMELPVFIPSPAGYSFVNVGCLKTTGQSALMR